MRNLNQLTVLAFAVVPASGAYSSSPSSSPPTTVDHPPAQFVEGPCAKTPEPVPLLANARCGELVVPVNRTKADGPTMRLAIAISPSKNAATHQGTNRGGRIGHLMQCRGGIVGIRLIIGYLEMPVCQRIWKPTMRKMVVIAAGAASRTSRRSSALLSFCSHECARDTRCARSIDGNRPPRAGPSVGVGDQRPELGVVVAQCPLQVGSDVLGVVRW